MAIADCWEDVCRRRRLPVIYDDIEFGVDSKDFWSALVNDDPSEIPLDLDISFCAGPGKCHNGILYCWLCGWTPDDCDLEWPDHCDHCERCPEAPELPQSPEWQLCLNLKEPSPDAQIATILAYLDRRGNRRLTALFNRAINNIFQSVVSNLPPLQLSVAQLLGHPDCL